MFEGIFHWVRVRSHPAVCLQNLIFAAVNGKAKRESASQAFELPLNRWYKFGGVFRVSLGKLHLSDFALKGALRKSKQIGGMSLVKRPVF